MRQTLNIQVQIVDGQIESVTVNGKPVEGKMDSIARNCGEFFEITEERPSIDLVRWEI